MRFDSIDISMTLFVKYHEKYHALNFLLHMDRF